MISCQLEQWSEALPEMMGLFPEHYKELALDQSIVKLSPNLEVYAETEQAGRLHLVTVRDDGKLVGYYIGAVVPHTHYKDAGPMGLTDAYYIKPEYRNGTGVKLIATVEETMKARGVIKIYMSTKIHQNHTVMLEGLGYKATDIVLTKRL